MKKLFLAILLSAFVYSANAQYYEKGQRDEETGLTVAERNGKYGYLNDAGREAIVFYYNAALPFRDGVAAVRSGKKWGFIGQKGNTVISFVFDDVWWGFYDGYAWVKKDKKWGMIDKKGNTAVAFDYEMVKFDYVTGFADVRNRYTTYYFDTHGKAYTSIVERKQETDKVYLPTITWMNFKEEVGDVNFTVNLCINSASKITDKKIYLNGVVIADRGISSVVADGCDMKISKELSLHEGVNTIKVSIKNEYGTSVSEKTVKCLKPQDIPVIEWLSMASTTKQQQFKLKAGIKTNSEIQSLTITLNDRVLTSDRAINPVPIDGYQMMIDRYLTLTEGKNTIKIEVKNSSGTAVSEKTVVYKADKPQPVIVEKRIALVIGNTKYNSKYWGDLETPTNDVKAISKKLKSLGFEVLCYEDKNQKEMKDILHQFGNKVSGYEVALFYYAGHGCSVDGINYLVPVEAYTPDESFVESACISADIILSQINECPMKIVMLDACRSNNLPKTWHRGGGNISFASMPSPEGTFISFSTSPNRPALDGEVNSPYASAVLSTLDKPNLSITDFFQEVLTKVAKETNKQQVPWTSSSFIGKFYFNKK